MFYVMLKQNIYVDFIVIFVWDSGLQPMISYRVTTCPSLVCLYGASSSLYGVVNILPDSQFISEISSFIMNSKRTPVTGF